MERIGEKTTQLELTNHPEVVDMRRNILKRVKLLSEENGVLIEKALETGWDPERVKKVVAELRECQKETKSAEEGFGSSLR